MADLTRESFLLGTTVLLRAKVSEPGLRTPLDPDTLVLVSVTGPSTVATPLPVFALISEGEYGARLQTSTLLAGTYVWIAQAVKGTDAVVQRGQFVLTSP